MLSKAQLESSKAIKLSENFTLYELIKSESYPELVEWPSDTIIEKLRDFAVNVLQPLRDKFGAILVSSGYRNPVLNKRVGGVGNSVHMIFDRGVEFLGVAADIIPLQAPIVEVFNWAFDHLPIKTAIIYRKKSVTNTPFIHLDTRSGRLQKAKLEKTGPSTYSVYQE